ncbi:Zinc finger, SWIM-type [Candidatus Nanopelagicaceae bacterium]
MFERKAKQVFSTAVSKADSSSLNFGTDLNRDPVYLSGEIKSSKSFAQAMLVLGKVVQIQRPVKKDHSEYQKWVEGEYLRILERQSPERLSELRTLNDSMVSLQLKREALNKKLNALQSFVNSKKKEYFNWLYENDRNAWIVLDPIVSVQNDGTFFEAFSGDESIYARVFLPHTQMINSEKPLLGTTNIDFSLLLEREFERVRSYRPMSLTVGLKKVDFQTEAATVEEEKIPLPETWVRGLVEVQSVLALAPTEFEMSADALAEIIARLQSEKEKHGPRSLKFILKPGSQVRVEIEPWGEVFADDWCTYSGAGAIEVKVWGRRRLAVLKEILVGADRVKVHLLGSGMPSFWTVAKDDIELTVGLSGWTSNDWASKAKFSAFIPTANVNQEMIPSALESLIKSGSATTADLSRELHVTVPEASVILQKLCLQGKAMFDPSRNIYRWRDLFPTLDLYQEDDSSRESRGALALSKDNAVKITLDDMKDGIRYLSGVVTKDSNPFNPTLELDLDNRPKYAQCTCSFYNFNKLRQGPCRHMIALLLVGDAS